MIIIIKREDYLEILVIREGIEIHKTPMSWDLNQLKGWL